MKYQNIHFYSDESFRRITGVKRHTFAKMVEILNAKYLEEHSSNSRNSGTYYGRQVANIFANTAHTFILLFMKARYTASSNG